MAIGAQRGFAAQKLQDESHAQTGAQAQTHPSASAAATAPPEALRAVDGDWIFVEDRTEGRTLEQLTSPMSSSFSMKVESDAVILNGHGSGHKDVRVALDGTATERPEPERVVRYRGGWQDGAFTYEVSFERNAWLDQGSARSVGPFVRQRTDCSSRSRSSGPRAPNHR